MDLSRISVCTYPFRDQPLPEALEAIAAAGFHKIDLLGRLPHFSLKPEECDPLALKAMIEAHGLQVANLGTYVGKGFADADRAARERELTDMQRAIDLAVFLGARSIRVSPGNEDPACIEQITPYLRQSAAYAAAKEIYLGIENHHGGISGQPETCRKLAAAVASPFFGVLYEPFNLMADGTDYRSALATMKDHIVHVHFKDGRATPERFQLTMLGEGEIDFRWIIAELDGLGYRGDFALEYELESPTPAVGLQRWYQAALSI